MFREALTSGSEGSFAIEKVKKKRRTGVSVVFVIAFAIQQCADTMSFNVYHSEKNTFPEITKPRETNTKTKFVFFPLTSDQNDVRRRSSQSRGERVLRLIV